MTPVLSIVVPTKDRHECLIVLVRALLRFRRADVEILVADNSADPTPFRDAMAGVQDPRLRYHHDPAAMSLIANCDRAVALARGEYVLMLGDDDGVAEWVLELVDWLREGEWDAAVTNTPVYRWPGVRLRLFSAGDRGVGFARAPGGGVRRLAVRREAAAMFRKGASDMGRVPRVYQGLVRRAVLDRMRAALGTCFPGPSPDMANAVALEPFVATACWVDFPVVITGSMPRSGAGRGASRDHVGAIRGQSHLPANTAETWTPTVPAFWSGPTVWAESALKALSAVPGLRHRLNHAYLYAACLVFHSGHRAEVRTALRHLTGGNRLAYGWYVVRIGGNVLRVLAERGAAFVRTVAYRLGVPGFHRVEDVPTVEHWMAWLHRRYGPVRKPWDRRWGAG